MGCCQYYTPTEDGAGAFTVEMPRITFGRGTLGEIGARARERGIGRAALFTDPRLADSAYVATARSSLRPAVFRFTAQGAPERHLEAAICLGAQAHDAGTSEAGEVVAERIVDLMRACRMPNGIGEVGFTRRDAGALADSAMRQKRAIGNSPREAGKEDLVGIIENAVAYW